MKRKKLKNYLKIGFLLFGFSIFISACESNVDAPTNENIKYTASIIDASKLKNIQLNKKITELKKDYKEFSKNNKVPIELNLNIATYIEAIDADYHSYSFYIKNNENNFNIKNIVLSSTESGDYEADLVTYILTEYERKLIDSGVKIDLLEKTIIEPFDVSLINLSYRSQINCGYELMEVQVEIACGIDGCWDSKYTTWDTIYEWVYVCSGGGSDSGSGSTDSGGDGSGFDGTSGSNGTSSNSSTTSKATSLTTSIDGEPKAKCQSLKVLTQTDSTSVNIKPIIDSLRTKTNLNKEWSTNFQKKMIGGELHSLPDPAGLK